MPRSPCRLGVDELYAIMLHATADSIDAKFAVAQVCRLWRAVALDTAVLWSTFSIRTRSDAYRLLTVLGRTRRTRLSISLDFSGRTRSIIDEDIPVFNADDRLGIYHDVSPHMPRVRALAVDYGQRPGYIGSFEPIDVLFEFPIPYMEHLSIQWRVHRWVQESDVFRYRPVTPVFVPIQTAVRLRSLRLMNAVPCEWDAVAVPTLEVLDVDTRIRDPAMLRTILDNCHNLTSLTVYPSDDHSFEFLSIDTPVTQMHSIRRVRVGMPFVTIWSVLSSAIDLTTLEDVVVSVPGNEPSISVLRMYEALLKGFGRMVSCALSTTFGQASVPTTAEFEVSNEYSWTRRVEIARVYPFREHVRGFWTALSRSEHGLRTIRSISISRHMWIITSAAFCDYCPVNVVTSLTVELHESLLADESFLSLVRNGPKPRAFPCPELAKITFDVQEGPSKKLRLVQAILGLVDRVGRTHPVEICFSTRQRERWVTRFQEESYDKASWLMCAHCMSLTRATVISAD